MCKQKSKNNVMYVAKTLCKILMLGNVKIVFSLSQPETFIFTFIQSRVLVLIEYTCFYKLADYDFSKAFAL